jgi:hypothetical protein
MNNLFKNNSGNHNNSNSSSYSRIIAVFIFVLGLVGIYYLYQYLYGPRTGNAYSLITEIKSAQVEKTKPILITSDKLPLLYEGGEFTVSTWIYVNTWSYKSGQNKPIVFIGGSQFDTIRIFLGGYKPTLHVRLDTNSAGATMQSMTGNSQNNSLSIATKDSIFNGPAPQNGLLDSSSMCDLPEVGLQRWVQIVVAVNGKTVDVYMDGKLARSCVMPSFFPVDSQYNATLLAYGGFGGQIANAQMYDAALNPEAIYKMYMAGPEPINSITDLFSSIFSIGVTVNSK